jgi:gliding motility-associated-like protein
MPAKLLIWIVIGCLCLHASASAQVCNGSLGDPVAEITFGSGGTVGTPLPASATLLSFSSQDCPTDGQYSIRSQTVNCFSNIWHSLPEDHTPSDINGRFLLVNGALNPGLFFVDTLKNLCPNINYELSMWFLNLLKPNFCSGSSIKPDVTVEIASPSGTLLVTYKTGQLPELDRPSWRQHYTAFTIPGGFNAVVIRMYNSAKGGCGNEFAVDDIAIRPCGSLLQAAIATNNAETMNVCDGDNKSIPLKTAFAGTFNNPSYQWQESKDQGLTWNDIPGAVFNTYNRPPTSVGTYEYRITIAENNNGNITQCRIASNPIIILVNSLPNADITNYVYGCYGSDVILFASGGNTYKWQGPNNFTSTLQKPVIPAVKFNDAGNYNVLVTDHRGCSSTASMTLSIYPAATATKGPDVSFCEGDGSIITAGGGIRYKWIPAKGLSNDTIPSPYARPSETTLYQAVVLNEYGCTDTADINVVVWKKPVANAGPDRKMRTGVGVVLQGSVKGDDFTYTWTPVSYMENANSLQPKVTPEHDAEYTLKAVSNKGCGFTVDKVKIKVYDGVIVPNAFSPNGDGINDTWLIEPLDLFDEAEVIVYDRYGQIAWQTKKGYTKPWDGKRNGNPLPIGTYYYSIDLKVNKEPKIIGSLTILR